jgi:hypothetical protein
MTSDILVKLGNCVTTTRIKNFLLLLYITPITFMISVLPIIRPLSHYVVLSLKISQSDVWARNVWWDWWGSWIFVGGPLGRWFAGMLMGYWIRRANREDEGGLGRMVETGSARLAIVVAIAILFSLFSAVSISHFTRHVTLFYFTGYGNYGHAELDGWPDDFGCSSRKTTKLFCLYPRWE